MASSGVILAARAVRHKLRAMTSLGAFWPAAARAGKLLARGQVRQFARKLFNETAAIRTRDAAPRRSGPPLVLAGHILRPGGYDCLVLALLRGLIESGINVYRDPASVLNYELIPPHLHPSEGELPGEPPRLVVAPPHLLHRFHPDRRTAAFSMWETDVLPASGVAALNRCGRVIVPSRWGAECFRSNGVMVPIDVVPLGHDHGVFNFQGEPVLGGTGFQPVQVSEHRLEAGATQKKHRLGEPVLGGTGFQPVQVTEHRLGDPVLGGTGFQPVQVTEHRLEAGATQKKHRLGAGATQSQTVFGTAGALDDGGLRKNVQRVIDLFRSAFPNEADVRLRVKITPASPPVNSYGDPRIEVMARSLSDRELADWYHSLSAYVNGSFGEGFGLHLLEAMACGRPLISTSFSGVGQFFDGCVGYEIGYRLIEARNGIYSGRWADPDEGDLVAALRCVHANRAEAEQRGRRAAERAAQLTWADTTRQLLAVLAPAA